MLGGTRGGQVSAVRIFAAIALTVALAAQAFAGGTLSAASANHSDGAADSYAYTNTNSSDNWEVWALDQGAGLNRIHIYDHNLEEREVIEFGSLDAPHSEVLTPHMIDFDATNRYAVVASTASGTVSIIRTRDYQVIETIDTGGGTHMASFAPDNETIWVASIGAKTFTKIAADINREHFEIVEVIDLIENVKDEGWEGWQEKSASIAGMD